MTICPTCNEQNSEKNMFCINCGHELIHLDFASAPGAPSRRPIPRISPAIKPMAPVSVSAPVQRDPFSALPTDPTPAPILTEPAPFPGGPGGSSASWDAMPFADGGAPGPAGGSPFSDGPGPELTAAPVSAPVGAVFPDSMPPGPGPSEAAAPFPDSIPPGGVEPGGDAATLFPDDLPNAAGPEAMLFPDDLPVEGGDASEPAVPFPDGEEALPLPDLGDEAAAALPDNGGLPPELGASEDVGVVPFPDGDGDVPFPGEEGLPMDGGDPFAETGLPVDDPNAPFPEGDALGAAGPEMIEEAGLPLPEGAEEDGLPFPDTEDAGDDPFAAPLPFPEDDAVSGGAAFPGAAPEPIPSPSPSGAPAAPVRPVPTEPQRSSTRREAAPQRPAALSTPAPGGRAPEARPVVQTTAPAPMPPSPSPPKSAMGTRVQPSVSTADSYAPESAPKSPLTTVPAPVQWQRECAMCGFHNEPDAVYCGECGTAIKRPVSGGPAGPQRAELVQVSFDGNETRVFALSQAGVAVDAATGALVPTDQYQATAHALFRVTGRDVLLTPPGERRQVFVRIPSKKPTDIHTGSVVRIGHQILLFEAGARQHNAWGTLTATPPSPEPKTIPLDRQDLIIGRETGHIQFPNDYLISGTHLRIYTVDGRFLIYDLNSTNGTYLEVTSPYRPSPGEVFIIGDKIYKTSVG